MTGKQFLHTACLFLMFIFGLALLHRPDPQPEPVPTVVKIPEEMKGYAPEDSTEILWLARCIYSETKRPHEMELVAWVVRNRVEAEYRNKSTYHEVVLDRKQFSAFNSGKKRHFYTSLEWNDTPPRWQEALEIAEEVYFAPGTERKWPRKVLHFYSPQSMKPRNAVPVWARGKKEVAPPVAVDRDRFRFFSS